MRKGQLIRSGFESAEHQVAEVGCGWVRAVLGIYRAGDKIRFDPENIKLAFILSPRYDMLKQYRKHGNFTSKKSKVSKKQGPQTADEFIERMYHPNPNPQIPLFMTATDNVNNS